MDVFATQKQTFQDKQAAFRQFLWAWFDTMAILNQQPNLIFQLLAKELGQPSDNLIKDYAGVEPGTIALNQQMFGPDKQIDGVLTKTQELLRQDKQHSQITHPFLIVPSDFIISTLEKWSKPL
jgi:hypothetical protein